MDGVAATCQALPWEPHILLSDLTAALELLHQPWELPQGMYAARGAGRGAAASGAGSGFSLNLGLLDFRAEAPNRCLLDWVSGHMDSNSTNPQGDLAQVLSHFWASE